MDVFTQYSITTITTSSTLVIEQQPFYYALLLQGTYITTIDLTEYNLSGYNVVFISPYQLVSIQTISALAPIESIRFHGDFYCIEYHKKEVACNGILFNNIFVQPHLAIDKTLFIFLKEIYSNLHTLIEANNTLNEPIIKTYLQLLLAYCSKEKITWLADVKPLSLNITTDLAFEQCLQENFIQQRQVSFYAAYFNLSIDAFSKQIKKKYGKSPSKLIAEKLVLEAKKQLHLTTQSIKEIAHNLNFNDEFYFSRFFKKEVGTSPKHFRKQVGISIVAK